MTGAQVAVAVKKPAVPMMKNSSRLSVACRRCHRASLKKIAERKAGEDDGYHKPPDKTGQAPRLVQHAGHATHQQHLRSLRHHDASGAEQREHLETTEAHLVDTHLNLCDGWIGQQGAVVIEPAAHVPARREDRRGNAGTPSDNLEAGPQRCGCATARGALAA
eukprot:CAMPEP_0198510152 /NCGR_PEP_ID=MMETSP1462-20131121/14006_1 /TAXON_ID=1333877 /ORGANISM="Brandtodinium nutriculum, Strain RCC3387" /LENGTH=162 /DNA_ID=CAMNT_0044239477 /DNA_START=268 /DNA_END=755 /DNA_ORIENTATION=+